MPLARVDLAVGKSAEYRQTIGDVIYDAMLSALNVPQHDRFQVITEHPPEGFIFDATYLGIQRTADCIFIQLILNEGRTVDTKRAFYRAVVDGLRMRLNVRTQDVLIVLVEVKKENWSFGNGEAQYAPL
jgi:phenylpyruvate tautomerase PptA (4-oxalocrotonate tautomerase family)